MKLYETYAQLLNESTAYGLKFIDIYVRNKKEEYEAITNFKKQVENVNTYLKSTKKKSDISISDVKTNVFSVSIKIQDASIDEMDKYEQQVSNMFNKAHPQASDKDIENGILKFTINI